VLRRILGPKGDEMEGDWRKLHNEELHKLRFIPNIIRMIKSRRMRWTEYIAQCEYGFGGKARRKETTKDLDICGRMKLKLILEE
jgi:predicted SprT family Zn-dependent metalloprotease